MKKNVEYFSKLINEPTRDTVQYYRSLEPFEMRWGIAKISGDRKNPDCGNILQACCEMIIDAALSDPPYVDGMIKDNAMAPVLVKMLTAKIAATLIGQDLFDGSDVEKKLFKIKFDAILQTEVKNAMGQIVTLLEFMQNPAGNLPISDELRKTLFDE